MSQALETVREELYSYAGKSIIDYYGRITRQAKTTPAAARAYEQTELIRYQLDVRDEAQRRYTKAFERDKIAYPGLLWTEEVEARLKDPVFKYCDVLATACPESEPESSKDFKVVGPEANPEKFSYAGPIGLAAGGILTKALVAALFPKTTALSVVGTVLIVSGAVWGAYTLFRNGKQVPATQVVGKELYPAEEELSQYMDLEKLMKAQQDCNLQVMRQWLENVYKLAEMAEQKKTKEG